MRLLEDVITWGIIVLAIASSVVTVARAVREPQKHGTMFTAQGEAIASLARPTCKPSSWHAPLVERWVR